MRIKSIGKAFINGRLVLFLTGIVTGCWLLKESTADRLLPVRSVAKSKPASKAISPNLALPQGASPAWFAQVQRNIAASEYEIRWCPETGAYQSPNRSQNMRFTYLADGFRASPRVVDNRDTEWQVGIRLSSLKKGSALQPFRADGLQVQADTAQIQGEPCRIEYKNEPKGMRQNFIIEKPLPGEGNLELVFSVERKGVQLNVASEGDAVSFTRTEEGGAEVMRYSDLKVFDARQQPVFAKMTRRSHDSFAIVVDDAEAAYPLLVDPLSTSLNWNAEGNQAGASYGWKVASAGDINGDGYSDAIVGAPGFDGAYSDTGKIFVYHGSASGLATSPNWTAESGTPGMQWGWSLSTAGDVNGDGYSDIIIGSPARDGTLYGDSGAVYLWHGSSTGLGTNGTEANADWKIYAEGGTTNVAVYMQFGYSVSTAGDVNGDGYSDVVIGAPFKQNGAGTQYIYVYHGSSGGLGSSPAYSYGFGQNYAMFGFAVALAGDINGDGYSDIIASAPYYDNGQTDEGTVVALAGSATGLGTTLWNGEGNQAGANFGYSISTAGDVTGEGLSDVIIGAPYYDSGQTDEGMVFVHRGSSSVPYLSTSPWQAQSDQAGAILGASVGLAGDINGDGYSDIIVGAPYYDNGQTDEGKVFVWYGGGSYYTGLGVHGTPTNADWTVESDQASAYLGISVDTAGDVNGDGYSDAIIGAHGYDNGQTDEGRAFVYHGSAAGVSASADWSVVGAQLNGNYGSSVASAGDVNGDGYGDIIVEAYNEGTLGSGKIFVYHGSASGPSTTANWTAESDSADGGLGTTHISAGDVNGDGYGDIIVGAWLYDNGHVNEGAVFVWHGSSTGLGANGTPSNADWMGEGNATDLSFGTYVASAGDVNGDGYDDVLISWNEDSGVWHGSATGLGSTGNPSNADWKFDGLGYATPISPAGDVNGDGYADIIVTRPYQAYVFYGSSTGLGADGTISNADWKTAFTGTDQIVLVRGGGDVNGDGYSDIVINDYPDTRVYYGSSTGLGADGTEANADWTQSSMIYGASAGDVNGDGYSDLVCGNYNDAIAKIFLGSSSGLAATADRTLSGEQASSAFGISLGSAGDVNGDGYADVIIGADQFLGASTSGKAYLYYGNQLDGLQVTPRQWRTNLTTPVLPGLSSGSTNQVGLGLYARSFLGRGDVKLQVEVKALGTAFNGSSLDITSSWSDSGTAGVAINTLKTGLSSSTRYKWRGRIKYRLSEGVVQPYSRWIYPPLNAPVEIDFRTN